MKIHIFSVSLNLGFIAQSVTFADLVQRSQISMSVTWNKKSSRGIIPRTVQELPEDEARATAAGQDYQYPDTLEVEADHIKTESSAAEPIDEYGPREGYGRPRSAPSSDQTSWFPREGHGRPFSAGGAARRMMHSNVLATDDHEPHERTNPPHGDYFLHYPQTSLHGNSDVNSFDYNRYSRCERDLEVEDYFTDSSSSASEEDEILYDATVEDPDRVKHLTGCMDITKEEDYRIDLKKEGEKLQEDAMNNKIDDTGRRGMNNKVPKVTTHVTVKYKPKQRLSTDFSSINRGNQQMLYVKGTGSKVCPIKINGETTSNSLHKPVRSLYSLENIKGDTVPIHVTTKQGSSELNIEQTADSKMQVLNRISSSEIMINDKQIPNKSNTVPTVLSKPFLTRVKLAPPNEASITEQDRRNQKTIACETKYPIRAITHPHYKNEKTAGSVNSLANINGSTIVRRQIGVATIANKNELNSNQSDEIIIPLSKVKDNNIQSMAVSGPLTQSLEVGKMKLRVVASQARKQRDAGRR